MLYNYIKIAFRNLFKRKLFSGINIIGMAAAIGCSLLLFLTAFHEFSYDRFHENGAQIYRIYKEEFKSSGVERGSNMPGPMQPAILEEMPEITKATRWMSSGASIEQNGEVFQEGIRYTDEPFFEMFSFDLIKGDPASVLSDLNSIVLIERVADKLFPDVDPLGQSIKVIVNGYAKNFVVSGIAADLPDNSSLRLRMVTRIENHPYYQNFKGSWDNYNHDLFVQLPQQFSPANFTDRSKVIVEKYLQEEIASLKKEYGEQVSVNEMIGFNLQPLYQMRFDTEIGRGGISKAFPIGLLVIALFILAIACINFVNLTLGSSLSRSLEVGIRKVMGAGKRQLITQFWGEALLVIFISLMLGTALAQWLLPEFNSLFRKSLTLNHPNVIIAITTILVFAGLIGGAYPSLVLSRFPAADVLRRNTIVQKPGRLRNLLVLVQFTLSVLLISCTIIVSQQLNYLRNKPLGFNEHQVLSVPLSSELDSKQVIERMRNELASFTDVKNITATYNNIGLGKDGSTMTSKMGFDQQDRELFTHWNQVDFDYLETMEIPLVSGRSFSREHATDTAKAILINETFARQIGEENPIGVVLELNPKREVIGVMKDHHFQSLANPIEPLSLVLGDQDGFRFNYMFIRMNAENVPETMKMIEQTWKEINPKSTFAGSFLNDNAERQYQAEALMGKIFISAAVLAIILSCMGLFGIAVLVITQRTKEIGIRKILGASVSSIVGLVSKDFLIMVVISIVLAAPLAWIGMQKWLENYAYSIKVQWWVFLLSGLLAIGIAFVTISLQSIRAAMLNPANTLKSE